MNGISIKEKKVIATYWLTSVGIGPGSDRQKVFVPLRDVANYKLPDGSHQIDIVNLTGVSFNPPDKFMKGDYLAFDPVLVKALTDGSVQALQSVGIKVMLSIVGKDYSSVGWGSIPEEQVNGFVNYLNNLIVGTPAGYGLDGIDIDDEYSRNKTTGLLVPVKIMRKIFAPEKIISKALFNDLEEISELVPYLTFGGIMTYGDSSGELESIFQEYVKAGFDCNQLLIGVNAGPIDQGGSFTSIKTTQELASWEPSNGTKLGMMLWSFSQDIQQFTASPQNQPHLKYPNQGDHLWQKAIISAMHGLD